MRAAQRNSGTGAQVSRWFRSLGSPLLASLCAAVPLPLFGQAPDANAVLIRAASAYTTAGSLEADFRQVIADENIGTFRSRGRLAQ